MPEELRALGRSLDRHPGEETMVERVLAQIRAEGAAVPEPEPPGRAEGARHGLRRVRHGVRARWRAVAVSVCGLLTVAALTPPVRAAVFDWFDFGGVEVRYDPSPPPPAALTPGCGEPSVSLARAEREAGFRPAVPAALGKPDAVVVTRERAGRSSITLCWREHGRTVRLDEFPAALDPGYTKLVPGQPEWIDLGNGTALWFARPHRLELWLLDPDGGSWKRAVRPAGPTLLWTDQRELTLRLEGVGSKARATEIAKSVPERAGQRGAGTGTERGRDGAGG
ncbi:hypothetical protein JGB26_15010 [Streptomyces flavofungini]|uniref:Uncharacterized protein n=1 Tax=Streptomyces flavofungini TaxID=68200 RepID=A0ABS0X5C6_9ACTN|nr:hypothetical protein [Streptomyces flavofungini]